MRFPSIIFLLALVLIIAITPFTMRFNQIDGILSGHLMNESELSLLDPPNSEEFVLTWTSRWDIAPNSVNNGSKLIGDHIILNATFHEELLDKNITRTEVKITDGFTFSTTRSLKPISNSGFLPSSFPFEECDWIEISGISKGNLINITGYADSYCDYFVFDGLTPIEEYDYYEELLELQMCTMNNPEHGEIIWNSDSDVMALGCYNYDNSSEGNWSVYIEVGDFSVTVGYNNSITLDTYWLDNVNDTYEIITTAYTSTNTSIIYRIEGVEICNFFTPHMVITGITRVGSNAEAVNISWQCFDLNADDMHLFSIWISSDNYTYMLLAANRSQTWYYFDSTSWLEMWYTFRIRVYSVDLSPQSPCTLDNPPTSYWPGDYSQKNTFPIDLGGITTGPSEPYYYLSVLPVNDISYPFSSQGNDVTFPITIHNHIPNLFKYYVEDNMLRWFDGFCYPTGWDVNLVLNLDGLSIGIHEIRVLFELVDSNLTRTFTISVYEDETTDFPNWEYLLRHLAIGISVGSSVVIVTVIVLIVRLQRHRVLETSLTSYSDTE